MGVGAAFKRLRLEAGLGRREFTELLDISESRYTKMELKNQNPRMDRPQIEEFFGMNIEKIAALESIRSFVKRPKTSTSSISSKEDPNPQEGYMAASADDSRKETKASEQEQPGYDPAAAYREKYIESLKETARAHQENAENLKNQVTFLQRITENHLIELAKAQQIILAGSKFILREEKVKDEKEDSLNTQDPEN